jgi:ADP-ribose pyrophosphatase YjhB (NUDIX family)
MALSQQYVATSYVYDRETDRFLFVLHKKLGKWLPPGGHLEDGEEPQQGALRELLEETGLQGRVVSLLETPDVHTATIPQLATPFCVLAEPIPANAGSEAHLHIDFVYVVEIDTTQPLDLLAAEVSHARWIATPEVATLETYENVKRVCREISVSSSKKRAASTEGLAYTTPFHELALEPSPEIVVSPDVQQIL